MERSDFMQQHGLTEGDMAALGLGPDIVFGDEEVIALPHPPLPPPVRVSRLHYLLAGAYGPLFDDTGYGPVVQVRPLLIEDRP